MAEHQPLDRQHFDPAENPHAGPKPELTLFGYPAEVVAAKATIRLPSIDVEVDVGLVYVGNEASTSGPGPWANEPRFGLDHDLGELVDAINSAEIQARHLQVQARKAELRGRRRAALAQIMDGDVDAILDAIEDVDGSGPLPRREVRSVKFVPDEDE